MVVNKVNRKPLFFFLGCCLFSLNALAQFTYVGGNFEFYYTNFETSTASTRVTGIRGMNVSGNILIRPVQNIGIGINIGTNLFERYKYNFEQSATSNGSTYYHDGEFSFGNQIFFNPTTFEYNIESNNPFTLFARFFLNNELNPYTDLRYSTNNLKETYIFQRPAIPARSDFSTNYEAAPSVNVSYQEILRSSGVGLGVGIMPHISKHLYIDMGVALDFIQVNGKGFSNLVAFKHDSFNGLLQYADVKSALPGNHITFKTNIGIGIYL